MILWCLLNASAVTSGIILTGFLVTLVLAQQKTVQRYLPEYDASGDLILPKGFHECVNVGSLLTASVCHARVNSDME
jgi:hypothetical protein